MKSQVVLADLETNEPWFYPLFLLWLSTGMRNAEIRGLTWDCIRWEEGEVLVCKSLRRMAIPQVISSWATTKTGRACGALDRSGAAGVETAQGEMELLGIYDPYGLVFVTPTSHTNIYDHLAGRVEAVAGALWIEAPPSLRPTP